VGNALRALMPRVNETARADWLGRVAELREKFPLRTSGIDDPRTPYGLIAAVAEFAGADAIVTTDVGQHQMWVAQAYPVRRPRTLLTSGGLGTMGFGLPAAIGAALALEERGAGGRVVCVSGDGSILMNIQELATLAELDLPVAVLVFNNAQLGLVRQQQELFYGRRYAAAHFASVPDFAALARAFGVRGVRLDPARDPLGALGDALAAPGPCVIDIPIHEAANVYPMVPPGAANREMIAEPEPAALHA